MKSNISIYLAGHIKKSTEANEPYYWSQDDKFTLKEHLANYNVSLLDPAHRTDSLTDATSIFGRDMLQVALCDVVFVDARSRRGLGVGAEMMWAKVNAIPVVTLCPKESHYNKKEMVLLDVPVKNYIHPFIASLSDAVVDTIAAGALWIDEQLFHLKQKPKDIESVRSAIRYYIEQQLPQDTPMQQLLASNPELQLGQRV